MIRAVIIDDDEVSRKVLSSFIERTSSLELIGDFSTAIEALETLEDEKIDVFFLDVEMPEMNGFQFLNHFKRHSAQVILVTSKREYAVMAFEYDITDYLVKPIEYSRFLQAVNRVKENNGSKISASNSENALFVKDENIYTKLKFDQIKWIEASGDYVSVVSEDKSYLVHTTMKQIESHLPKNKFLRVHRSYIINTSKLDNFDKEFCVVSGKMIPIGKSYRKELIGRLNVL